MVPQLVGLFQLMQFLPPPLIDIQGRGFNFADFEEDRFKIGLCKEAYVPVSS